MVSRVGETVLAVWRRLIFQIGYDIFVKIGTMPKLLHVKGSSIKLGKFNSDFKILLFV
jgi:hypothetical protein